ncbi:uncharacterized protein LOC110697610 [Chenopodium quinoa]|uniref:uncharacterized protein LOC110697610 n=1 Tax=Chenopodium quinoa TaxID=63459 RepID=UPI000B79A18B|nr:uncharacterized protein LOC110697610 [Chenopodium quinoa]
MKENSYALASKKGNKVGSLLNTEHIVDENSVPEQKELGKGSTEVRAFNGKLNVKGASLSYVPPLIKNGKLVVVLPVNEIDEGTKKWRNAIVLFVVGYYPTIASIKRFIADEWGKPTIVKPWSEKFDFNAEILRTIPLWVKLPNLPLNCWGFETLSRIGSILGVPICAYECTSRQLRVSFARMLIEIDITKPLAKSVWVESPKGEMVELTIEYEWTPPYCEKCLKVGHVCPESRPKQVSHIAHKPQLQRTWVQKVQGGKRGVVPANKVTSLHTANTFDVLNSDGNKAVMQETNKPSGGGPHVQP